jgi:PmbA protein
MTNNRTKTRIEMERTRRMESKENASNYIVKELLKKGAKDIVAHATARRQNQIKFVNNSIASVTSWHQTDIGLFLNYQGKIVSTTVSSLKKKDIDNTLNSVIRLAKFLPENREFRGIAKGPFSYKKIARTFDKKIEGMGEGGKRGVDIIEDAMSLARRNGARRVSGNLEFGSSDVYLVSSEGVEARDRGTSAYFSIRAFTDKDASGHKTACSRMLGGLDYRHAAEKAAEFSVLGKNPGGINAGRYDVVFDPMAFSVLLDNFASACSIFSVETGMSFLHDRLGKNVASEEVSIADNGRLPNGVGSVMFDDEGTPTRENLLVENGILKTYLHNTSTARRYKAKTTGNAGLVAPEPWNTILYPGKDDSKRLLSGLDKGLYITNVWYTRYQNYSTGDFSTIPRDSIFFIEKGKIKMPVKGIRVSDNMLSIMRNIGRISGGAEQVIGWETERPVVTPFVLVESVNVTKSV